MARTPRAEIVRRDTVEPSTRASSGRRGAHRLAWVLTLVVASLMSPLLLRADHSTPVAPFPGSGTATTRPVDLHQDFLYGDYGNPVRKLDRVTGRPTIDIEATITALSRASVSSYAYLIAPDSSGDPEVSQNQFDALPQLAAAAEHARIDIYVYLVPPSEAPLGSYAPYQWDYTAWASAIGRMASSHPSIKGIIIDDFGSNTVPSTKHSFGFTEAYVARMMVESRSYAPWLLFIPVMYYHDFVGARAVAAEYRAVSDAAIFPFFSSTDAPRVPGSTRDHVGAYAQGTDVSGALSCHLAPTCLQLQFPRQAPLSSGSWAVLNGSIRVVPNTTREVRFWAHSDSAADDGEIDLSVSIDQLVVQTVRLKSGWHQYLVSLTEQTRGKSSAEIEIKVAQRQGAVSPPASVLFGESSIGGDSSMAAIHAKLDLTTSTGVQSRTVASVPMIFMTYAMPLGIENGIGADSNYVQLVLQQVALLRAEGRARGSMIYCLNLTGTNSSAADPLVYAVVSRTYESWLRGE